MAGRISYYGNIVKDGLILDLDAAKLDSYPKTGTLWRDVSGFGNNITLINGPTFTTENQGGIIFDGTNDYADTSTQVKPTYFTLSCWFKATGVPSTNDSSGGVIIFNSVQFFGGVCQYNLTYSWLNQRVTFTVQSNAVTTVSANNSVLPNLIYNIVGVYNGSVKNLYINGVLVKTDAWTTNPIYPSSNATIRMGAWNNSSFPAFKRFFNGVIYQTLIYDRPLSASEVLQNYNATKGRYL